MSILQTIINDVYTVTSREDLAVDTLMAVRAATLKAHQIDFYPKDIKESGIQFDTAEYFQSFVYGDLFPRWRTIKYLRKYDSVGQTAGDFLDIVTPEETLDKSYNKNKTDLAYLAGSLYNIRSSTQEQYYLVGFYEHPDVTEAGYSSWIAREHPFAIVYEAARSIFKATGDDAKASSMDKAAMEQYMLLRQQIALVGE